jgi:acetyl-CoA synthetase
MNDQYPELYSSYRWFVPTQFNLAQACVHRWAENTHEGRRVAVYYEDEFGQREVWSYSRLSDTTNQLANGLIKMGVAPGDRVAVIMAQRPEAAAVLMAIFSVGAVATPLSCEFGPEAIGVRLRNAQARVAFVDNTSGPNLLEAQAQCPALAQIVGLEFQHDSTMAWHTLLARQPTTFKPLPTRASSPALLLYTSGTTGAPKGALLSHSTLIGNLPGFVASQNWFPLPNDVFWSPAGWAWTGGLMNSLLPTLYFGRPIVATPGKFSAARALQILERYHVTNVFFAPSVLRLIMVEADNPAARYQLSLRAVMTAGETLGETAFNWCRDNLGIIPNEMFGQTEMNNIIGNSHTKWPAKAGSMGRPYPGHRIAVLDDHGAPCGPGATGNIALNRYDNQGYPDPILFLRYWNNDDATLARFKGDWCLSGDLASVDRDGYFWYKGRRDDVFTSGGYLIAPDEIENCLLGHKAVASAAIVPTPDDTYGAKVKAYVVRSSAFLKRDAQALAHTLQDHVRNRLAPWQMPTAIEFVSQLPTTTSGKIRRHVLRARERQLCENARQAGTRNRHSA